MSSAPIKNAPYAAAYPVTQPDMLWRFIFYKLFIGKAPAVRFSMKKARKNASGLWYPLCVIQKFEPLYPQSGVSW